MFYAFALNTVWVKQSVSIDQKVLPTSVPFSICSVVTALARPREELLAPDVPRPRPFSARPDFTIKKSVKCDKAPYNR